MPRNVFIGDVHGCSRELLALLSRIGAGAGDGIYFVGDLVARGPDSSKVLQIVREIGAGCVLGNHEQRLLGAREARRRGELEQRLSPTHAALLDSLTDAEWAQLEAMPLYRDVPDNDMRVVHAGVVPGVPIEVQAPWMLTHLRCIDGRGAPTHRWGSTPWGARYQGPLHVVFGHNAQEKLQFHPFATGLDTGCVYGGALSAMVLAKGARVPPPSERLDVIVSVPAIKAYASMKGG